MIWIALLVIILLLIIGIIKKIKKLFIFAIIIIIALLVLLGGNFFSHIVNPNWLMKIEEVGIDGISNKIYVYNNKINIEYSMGFYPIGKEDLNNIDIEKVYAYIVNYGSENFVEPACYKVECKKDSTVRYITNDYEEIIDFINIINSAMVQIK